jgi:hypothetical protein
VFDRHIAIPVKDLRYLELYCNSCGNGILLHLDAEGAGVPSMCPCCPPDRPTKMNTELPTDILKFRQFREAMRKFEKRGPQFRIQED